MEKHSPPSNILQSQIFSYQNGMFARGHCHGHWFLLVGLSWSKNYIISKCQEPSYKKSLRLELKEPLCSSLTLSPSSHLGKGRRASVLPASGPSQVQQVEGGKDCCPPCREALILPCPSLTILFCSLFNGIIILISSMFSLNCLHPLEEPDGIYLHSYIHKKSTWNLKANFHV